MRAFFSIILLFTYILWGVVPVQADDSRLRMKIQSAMRDGVVLQIKASDHREVVGTVTEISDLGFTLVNPSNEKKETVGWKSVHEVKQLKPLNPQSLKSKQSVTIELLDGSKWKGVVSRKDDRGFTLLDHKTGTEIEIEYRFVKTVDAEPAGQKMIRRVMIGVGVGLAALVVVIGLLYAGD